MAIGTVGRRGALAGLAACAGLRFARAADADVTVTLSSTSFANAALFLARELGLFEKHGVKANLVVVDSGSLAVSALLSGAAQFTASGVSDVLVASARGQHFTLVANLYHGLSGSVVISKAAAEPLGITADSPLAARRKAVVGLRVAIPSATSSYVPPVNGAAAEAGGKPNLIYMAQPAMVAALQAGAVQAIMCGSPFWEPAVTGGFGFILLDGPGGEFPADAAPVSTTALITTQAWAADNKQVVQGMKAALDALAITIAGDPASVRNALARAYPKLNAETLDLSFRKNAANWSHPAFSEADVRHEMDILAHSRPTPGLDAVNPSSLLLQPD